MTNDQLMQAIKEVYGLINADTTPRLDNQGNEVSDGQILDRIFAIVKPIIQTV